MTRVLVAMLAVALLVAACDGYNDLPLQQREEAELSVEYAALVAGAPGRLQLVADLPADAAGPVVVVGSPIASSAALRVDGYSLGACRGTAPPADSRLRVCVAATARSGLRSQAIVRVGIVVEARGSARRFNVSGDVELP
jgi:uridine phosphorylase